MVGTDEIRDAYERGEHDLVLRLTDAALAGAPGNDAAHEYRARALLALGRLDEAERHVQDAVRTCPSASTCTKAETKSSDHAKPLRTPASRSKR